MLGPENPYYRQVLLLLEILPFTAKEPCFALKGGTAINLFIRNLPRLSIDIDLTYVPIESREESLVHIDEALRRLGSAIEKTLRGTTVQLSARPGERATKFQVRRGRERVQVEVSPVLRGTARDPITLETSPAVTEQFGLVRTSVLHPLEVYAGKLCAALDRQHPRDLFDVMQLQQAEGISRELFDLFLVYLLSGDRPIAEMLSPRLVPLSAVFNREFSGMTLVSVTPTHLEEARRKLVSDLHRMLTDKDKEFLLSVKRGHPTWHLFAYPKAAQFPAVLWKLENIERMTTERRAAAIAKLEEALNE